MAVVGAVDSLIESQVAAQWEKLSFLIESQMVARWEQLTL